MKITECLNKKKEKKQNKKEGYGVIDYIINRLPEIHIPGYQFCGPGTNLEKRLARGDTGINKLDAACKDHDIAYGECTNSKTRHKADNILTARAFKRIYSKDANLSERAAALLVTSLMGAKIGLSKIGLGLNVRSMHIPEKLKRKRAKVVKKMKKKTKRNVGRAKLKKNLPTLRKSIAFNKIVQGVRSNIKQSKAKKSLNNLVKAAIQSAKHMKQNKIVKMSRVLKIPKFGGSILSILPILTGLSAIGSITASAVNVVKAIKDIENAKKQLSKHNIDGERKIGNGLSLIYKVKGSGFYLKPQSQQQQQ